MLGVVAPIIVRLITRRWTMTLASSEEPLPSRLLARTARLGAPLLATIALRIGQLLTLLAFSWLGGVEGAIAVTSLGLVTGLLILLDSGGSAYLLSRDGSACTLAEYIRVLQVQTIMAGSVVVLGLGISLLRSPVLLQGMWMPLAAVVLAQALEAVLRPARAPWLQRRRDLRYALPELALAILKISVVVVAWSFSNLSVLVILPVISGVVLLLSVRRVVGTMSVGTNRRPAFLEIWGFGVAGSLSALYSQSPVVLAGFLMTPTEASGIVLAFRFVQASEVIPATFSNQLLPRMRSEGWKMGRFWGGFLGLGAGLAACLLFVEGYLETLSGTHWMPAVFVLLALSLIPKSGNYYLSAKLYSLRLPNVKTKVTAGVGGLSVGLYAILGLHFGPLGLAYVTLGSEVVLLISLFASIILLQRQESQPDE